MFPVNITKFLRTLFWRTSENGCFVFNMYYINIRRKRQVISRLLITLLTNYRNIWSKYFVYTHTTFLWRVAAYFIRRYVHQMYLLSQNYQGYRSNILFLVFNVQRRPFVRERTIETRIYRNSRPEVFCKKGVLRNFVKFTRKHLCQSLFLNKITGLRPVTLLEKRLWRRCLSVNFAKFLRTPFFTEHLWNDKIKLNIS